MKRFYLVMVSNCIIQRIIIQLLRISNLTKEIHPPQNRLQLHLLGFSRLYPLWLAEYFVLKFTPEILGRGAMAAHRPLKPWILVRPRAPQPFLLIAWINHANLSNNT